MKLYGSSSSGNCLKTRWVSELMGLPFEWIEIDTFSGATREQDFLDINPAGQVPAVILNDGRVLAQSNAIMLHLAENSHLVPGDRYDRAKMYEWLFWEQYNHEPAIAVRIARRHFLGIPEEQLDPALLTRGYAAIARMEQQLTKTQYLVGSVLTLADIALYAYTRNAHLGGFEVSPYRAVRAWISRVANELQAGGATQVSATGTAAV